MKEGEEQLRTGVAGTLQDAICVIDIGDICLTVGVDGFQMLSAGRD